MQGTSGMAVSHQGLAHTHVLAPGLLLTQTRTWSSLIHTAGRQLNTAGLLASCFFPPPLSEVNLTLTVSAQTQALSNSSHKQQLQMPGGSARQRGTEASTEPAIVQLGKLRLREKNVPIVRQ